MPQNPPAGWPSLSPYLVVRDAAAAIAFYVEAFGAREHYRLPMGDRIGHAELSVGDSPLMLADEFPERGYLGPASHGGTTVSLLLYVDAVDAAFARALAAGATAESAPADQFYGDRSGTLLDPFGHRWTLATHVEDVTPDEMQRRMAAM